MMPITSLQSLHSYHGQTMFMGTRHLNKMLNYTSKLRITNSSDKAADCITMEWQHQQMDP